MAKLPANFRDDDLRHFEATGAALPPGAAGTGYVEHDAARIWYATYGTGAPVILLHGGLGHSGNWGYQVPALVASGRRAVLIDSRGHGRSTRDERPFTYELMASDVMAVMDALGIEKAAIVGWSDGACTGLVFARHAPERVVGVFFFACNMDPSGTKPFAATPLIERCFARHGKDYAALSATPNQFDGLVEAVGRMQRSEPNYSPSDLAGIRVPVAVVQGEFDEFIKRAPSIWREAFREQSWSSCQKSATSHRCKDLRSLAKSCASSSMESAGSLHTVATHADRSGTSEAGLRRDLAVTSGANPPVSG